MIKHCVGAYLSKTQIGKTQILHAKYLNTLLTRVCLDGMYYLQKWWK